MQKKCKIFEHWGNIPIVNFWLRAWLKPFTPAPGFATACVAINSARFLLFQHQLLQFNKISQEYVNNAFRFNKVRSAHINITPTVIEPAVSSPT